MAGAPGLSGTSGGDGGDADLTFFLLTQNRQALAQINQLTQSLQRANAEQTKFAAGGGAPRGVEWWAGGTRSVGVTGARSTRTQPENPLDDFSIKRLKGKNFTFGAEGVRVGHIRLSRSGFGISEKTLADRGLEGAVIAGQLTGRAVQAVGKYMEARRRGDDIGQAVYSAATGTAGSLVRMGLEIFGFRQFAEGFNSIFGASPSEDFQKLYQDFWTEGLGIIELNRQKAAETKRKGAHRNRVEQARRIKNMWLTELNNPAARSNYWIEEIRRELADEESERRAMTRSLTGRPLWKVVNYSANEGIP